MFFMWLWEETGKLGGNPRRHRENIKRIEPITVVLGLTGRPHPPIHQSFANPFRTNDIESSRWTVTEPFHSSAPPHPPFPCLNPSWNTHVASSAASRSQRVERNTELLFFFFFMFLKLHNIFCWSIFSPFQCLKIVRPHSRCVASGGKLGRSWSLSAFCSVGAGSRIYECMEKWKKTK